MKLRVILLSLMVIVLAACDSGPTEHVFKGKVDGMDATSTLVAERDKVLSEHLVYVMSYEEAGITSHEEAKEAADYQREVYEEIANKAPAGAAKVNVEVDEEKEQVVMTLDLDYTTPANVQGLITAGFLEGNPVATRVSLEETKENYKSDGLEEQ